MVQSWGRKGAEEKDHQFPLGLGGHSISTVFRHDLSSQGACYCSSSRKPNQGTHASGNLDRILSSLAQQSNS